MHRKIALTLALALAGVGGSALLIASAGGFFTGDPEHPSAPASAPGDVIVELATATPPDGGFVFDDRGERDDEEERWGSRDGDDEDEDEDERGEEAREREEKREHGEEAEDD